MRSSLPLALTTFLATLSPFVLQADSLTVEGDLNVTATESANGDLTVDNELTVNPVSAQNSAFRVEPNGVVWAGYGGGFDATNRIPDDSGVRFMWVPDKAAFRVGHVIPLNRVAWSYDNIGSSSAAWGLSSEASGLISTAWGVGTFASGTGSTAWGEFNDAAGAYSTAWGDVNTALGDMSTVWGAHAFSSAFASTAWGTFTTASGEYSTSWGQYTYAESIASTALGKYNIGGYTYLDDGNADNDGDKQWFDLDPLLEVGNGTSSDRSNALTIIKNGQTTLENKYWDEQAPTAIPADPDAELDGDQSSAGEALVVNGHARFEGNVSINGEVTIARIPPQGDISMGAFTAQTPN